MKNNEGEGPFLCCLCERERKTRVAILNHVESHYKPFNVCSNLKCLRAVYLESKKEHIHITAAEVDALFATGVLAADGRRGYSRDDVLAALSAAKRARKSGKAKVEEAVIAVGGNETKKAGKKTKKAKRERIMIGNNSSNIRRIHQCFNTSA